MATKNLQSKLLRALKIVAEPERAPQMQAYMKSSMPYLGVSAAPLRTTCKKIFATHAVPDVKTWQQDVLNLWRGAQYREERYAAVELAADKRAKAFQTTAVLPLYEEMIVTGAWWDFVDVIASHRLRDILRAEPNEMKLLMRQWSVDDNIWKRRSAILCQLKFKQQTDLELLVDCIAPSLSSSEFFLRKAIGWSLRQYAWVDPSWVKHYVTVNETRLSGLSKREALKNL